MPPVMRTCPVRVAFMALAWSLGGWGLHAASAQTAAELFEPETVQDLHLFMNEGDLKELRDRYQENVYFPADLEWGDVKVASVGVRSRGLSSRNAAKPGLRVDFNRYVSGQRFLGLASIALDNLVSDPSMIRERVAMALFSRLGQPVPREAFARLYVNNVFQGLYAIIEAVDGDFLERTFQQRSGYLFERRFNGVYRGQDLGSDPAAYRNVFEPKNHELEADTVLYSPIRELFHEANQPVDTMWRERVGRYIDLAQLVTHVAIETFLSESDGVLGYAGMANFYLYRSASSERHQLIVWDKDRAFNAIDSTIFLRASENVLLSRALAFDDLRTLYLDTLGRCAKLASDGAWLENEVGRAATLIEASAFADTVKPYTNNAVQAASEFLRRFARERSAFVLEDIARARRAQ